jgi:hypothetical protein
MMSAGVDYSTLESMVHDTLEGPVERSACGMAAIQRMVFGVVREVLRGAAALASTAERACLHDNGFYKVPLISDPDERFSIRLHVWKRAALPSDTEDVDVHNHRWDFATKVLQGAYVSRTYRDSAVGKQVSKQRCWSSAGSSDYRVESEGAGHVELLEEVIRGVGSVYVLRSRVLHQVVPVEVPTVTMMVRGKSLRAWSDVRSVRVQTAMGARRRIRRPAPSELGALLASVMEEVEELGTRTQ